MDKTKKKELVSDYKERHPEMGVVSVTCRATGEAFYETTRDANSWFNRHRFELESGRHRNRRLQELWKAYGEGEFELAIVSELEYDDPTEVDRRDLKELLELCLMENPQARKI